MSNCPIIFQHYGYSNYLKTTLNCAVKSNPNKEVILLGDDNNKFLEKFGVKHFRLEDYANDDLINQFSEVYCFVAGEKFEKVTYGRKWVNFNFKKWFILNNFIKQNSIANFWVFDSDNLILKNLTDFEKDLSQVDCTTYNDENAIQGIINNGDVLECFCKSIVEIFDDQEFMKSQVQEFLKQGTFGFTMMRAFKYFFNNNVDIIRKPLDNAVSDFTFDECLFFEKNMEMINIPRFGKKIKRLYFDQKGDFFLKQKKDDKFLRLAVLNLSWVPLDVFLRIYNIKSEKIKPFNGIKEFDFNSSVYAKWNSIVERGLSKLQRAKMF